MRKLLLFICMVVFGLGCSSEPKSHYTVDINGKGDFTSIQACFDALESKPTQWRTVEIYPGVYREKLTLDVYKDKVRIIGLGTAPDEVRIVWNDHTGRVVDGHTMTTYDTWTLSIQSNDVYIENLTIDNDAPLGEGQAVALETRGDRIHIHSCRLIGNQDTFFTKGYVSRVRVTDSYIEGTTDYIFGPSIVLFDNCVLHSKSESFITAASTTERNKYGYVFRDCRITTDPNVKRLFLGRPWKSTARTVWIECDMPKAIAPEGWGDWHNTAAKGTSFYAEYGCRGEGADRRARVDWCYELTPEQLLEYTPEKIFAKKTGSEQFYDDWSGDFRVL